MKRTLYSLLVVAMLSILLMDIGLPQETEGTKVTGSISFDVTLNGLVARTRITVTMENPGSTTLTHSFSVDPGESRYISFLSINGQQAYMVISESDYGRADAEKGYDNLTGREREFCFELHIPPESSSTIVMTMEERLRMRNGAYVYSFPMDSIADYEMFERASLTLTDMGTHSKLGRDIVFDEDAFPLNSVSKDVGGIRFTGETKDPSFDDRLSFVIEPGENEKWYCAFIEGSSTTGHFMISTSPWREFDTTSRMVSFDSSMELFGTVMEDLNNIESGEEGTITGVYKVKEDAMGFDMEFMSQGNMINGSIGPNDPAIRYQDWAKRYWELAWMDHLLLKAYQSGGGNGTMEDVADFSVNRFILSPYTSFELYPDRNEAVPEQIEFDERYGDDSPSLADGTAIRISYDAWPDWNEYYREAPDRERYPFDESPERPFMDEHWPIFAIGMVLIIFIVLSGVIYSRLRDKDLLKQEKRKMIYEHIMNNPGDHFRSIQRAVDLEVGTLSHHMNILEKEQLIVSEQDGNNRRFWVAGVKRDLDKVRLSRIQERILKQIRSEPGITQVQIARKLGVSRKVIFYHIKFLADSEMVTEEKVKRRAHYYPTD